MAYTNFLFRLDACLSSEVRRQNLLRFRTSLTSRVACIIRMFDNETIVVAAFAAVAIILIVFWKTINGSKADEKRYPPSAPILKLIGAVLRGGLLVVPDHFMRSAEKLGPLIYYNVAGRLVFILNGKGAILEAFLKQSETFADRNVFWAESNILNKNNRGIVFARYDDNFKKNHKLSLAILKEFGFGVNSVSETRILGEVELMNQSILKYNGQPFYPKSLTVASTFCVVASILFGETFARSGTSQRISKTISQYIENHGFSMDFAPVLRFLPYFRRTITNMVQCQKELFEGIEKGIEFSKSVESEATFVKRFIEIQGAGYDHQDLLYIIRDFGFASAETVSTTLLWSMVELANHPKIQTRFQREIDDVISRDRFPSLDDKPRLCYAQAVILEVMRRHTLVPFYAPHATLRDAEVFGFHIPKGSLVIANAYSAHMDPTFWKDPLNFRPERFLDEENRITGSDDVIAFGMGKRSCLGEILGRQKVFLFLTNLVQRFHIRPPEGQASIRVKEIIALALYPSEFKVRLIPRFEDKEIHK